MAPTKMAAFTTSKSSLIKYNKLHTKYVQTKQTISEFKLQTKDIIHNNEYCERIANTDVPDLNNSGPISTNWY